MTDFTGGVLVPAAHAVVTAVAGVCALAASLQAYKSPVSGWLFLAAFTDILLIIWVMILVRWWSSMYQLPERPVVYQQLAAETVRIAVHGDHSDFNRGAFLDIPLSKDNLTAVGKIISAGGDFSMATLAGRGKPLSRAQFETLRTALISRDLCEWVNPAAHAQGCRLTRAGAAVLRHFDPNPPPKRDIPTISQNIKDVSCTRVDASEPPAMHTRFSTSRVLSRQERIARRNKQP